MSTDGNHMRKVAKNLPIAMLATAILMAPITLAYGQQAVIKDKIVGTWKLLSFYDESVDNSERTNVFGENPRGLLILTADERIALTLLDKSRQPAKGVDRGFFVRVDGNKLIFRTNPPARSPLTGDVSTRNVIFEREP